VWQRGHDVRVAMSEACAQCLHLVHVQALRKSGRGLPEATQAGKNASHEGQDVLLPGTKVSQVEHSTNVVFVAARVSRTGNFVKSSTASCSYFSRRIVGI
jgi:hypothetical protein